MFERNSLATRPDRMECLSNEELYDRLLASAASDYVNGPVIAVDDGSWLAR